MDHHPENSSSQSISSQQLPHIRTDTDTSSIHNSSLDPATKSLSITATRNTAPSTTRSAAPTSVLRAVHSQSDQQQQQPHFVKVLSAQSPHMSAAGLAASNGSVSFSSVDETGQPRRYSNPRPHAFQSATPSQPHRSTANDRLSVGGRGLRQSPLQRRNSGDNSVMDAISQSLNAHNDPELEGLPPMGEDSSSPDGSTVLYAKGFLISTSPGADREAGAANTSGPDYHLSAHLQDEEQQQQQKQPNNEHSVGDVSRSRGPAGNASGISHRLLTVEEIQERRRATSRPVSQAHSHVLSAAREPNKSTATTTNTNVNNRSVSLSGKPAHRQLSKEETEKMIALRQQQFKEQEKAKQQQRAAVAASAAQAAAAAASANTSATAASAPRRTSPPSQHTPPANSAGTGGAQLNSNAAPWLMPSEAAHRSMMQGQPNQQQQQQQQGSAGGVNFEWVRGVSAGHNGGMPVDGNAQPWPGAAHPWHDAAAAAAAASVGGLHPSFYPSGSGGTAETGVPHAVMGDGGSNGAAGFTWLPNATYWSTLDQQQQQQQSALIPSMASPAGQHDAFAFLAGSSAMMSTAGPLGSSSGNNTNNSSSGGANGGGGSSLGATAASPFSAPLSSLTMNVLKSLPMSQLQASIRQCDEQLQRVRQDRELLCHELQRRHYVAVASAAAAAAAGDPNLSLGGANGAAGGNGLGGGLVSGSAAAMGWPGSLPTALTPTHATTAAAAATGGPKGGPASTGSPSRFFAGPGMESLPQMLEVPSSVLHTAGAMNFSTAATSTGGGSSLNPPVVLAAAAAAPQQQHDGKHSGSDSSAAGASGLAPPVPKAGGSGWAATGDRFGPNTSHHQQQQQQQQQHVQNNNNNSTSVASRGQRHGNRSHAHSSSAGEKSFRGGGHNNNNNNNRSTSASFGGGGGSTTGNRCSHDNTPQEQKYLQTDPFSMYEHNKKIAAAKEAAA